MAIFFLNEMAVGAKHAFDFGATIALVRWMSALLFTIENYVSFEFSAVLAILQDCGLRTCILKLVPSLTGARPLQS